MLVLSRKVGQSIVIGDEICIVVNRISGNRVSIAVEAPPHMKVLRNELHPIRPNCRPDKNAAKKTIPVSLINSTSELPYLDAPRLAR